MSLKQLIKECTAQELFDMMANRLMNNIGVGGNYCDHDINGHMFCVLGAFMSREELDEIIRHDLNSTPWMEMVEDNIFPSKHSDLLQDLQVINDNVPEEQRLIELLRLAETTGLNTKALRPWLNTRLLGTPNECINDTSPNSSSESYTLLLKR